MNFTLIFHDKGQGHLCKITVNVRGKKFYINQCLHSECIKTVILYIRNIVWNNRFYY